MRKNFNSAYVDKNYSVQRRVNAKKHRRNKKRKLLLFYTFLIMSIFFIGSFFVVHTFFKISNIEITGTKMYKYEQIKKSANLNIGENIFRYKSDTIKNKLKRNLVYVDDAVVKKSLPNKVCIKIVEAKPSYFFYSNGELFVVSNHMKILGKKEKKPIDSDLIEIRGILVNNKSVGDYILDDNDRLLILGKLNEVFRVNKFKEIKIIDLTNKRNIILDYQNRICILLGNSSQLDYKIKFVKSIIDNNIDKNERGKIDAVNVISTSKVYFSPYKEVNKKHKEVEQEDSDTAKEEIKEDNKPLKVESQNESNQQ